MKVFILLSTLVCLSAATGDVRARFRETMKKYAVQDQINLSESPEVLKARLKSFMEFDARVQEINADDSRLFTAEDNFLSILTPEEREGRLGLNITGQEETEPTGPLSTLNVGDLPEHRDFSDVISDIKDQETCGSCWTFGASSALEGEIYFKTGDRKVSVSEQEWLECASGADGCDGGWPEWCFEYSRMNDRISPTSAYSYRPYDSGCYFWQRIRYMPNALADHNVRVAGYTRIPSGSLLKYASKHIVSVAIFANNDFQAYSFGLYMDSYCMERVNHAVGVVGYGKIANHPYWKVRNSWGTGWGNNGYILMDRQTYNMCSIEQYAHIPDVRCRDNTCVAPHPDEGDSGKEETFDPEDHCYKTVYLSASCRWGGATALNDCKRSGINRNDCYVFKRDNKCFLGSVKEKENLRSISIPCKHQEARDRKSNHLCSMKKDLSRCKSTRILALLMCVSSGIPLENCLVVRQNTKCYKTIIPRGTGFGTSGTIEYQYPCDEDDDNTGECDANAGLVLCSDCNCCKHKHLCHDYKI